MSKYLSLILIKVDPKNSTTRYVQYSKMDQNTLSSFVPCVFRHRYHISFHLHTLMKEIRGDISIYKIIQIVRALWLAIEPFYMSVFKHGVCCSFISLFYKINSISWKPLRFASLFPTPISCSPNLPRVYIRLCKPETILNFFINSDFFSILE